MRGDDALLLDMLIAARKIRRFTEGMTQADFDHSEMAQSAVTRELQVIGEAARMISDEAKAQHTHLEWSLISGMRNRVIHEYFNVDLSIVWDTIQKDIPKLVEQLVQLVSPDQKNDDDLQ
ncbi:MAG: DUF86 domain-containing protein [Anaerolineae bacterium]|nr:DUF86 domain-containing protein [Anaerolineae bacterium]